VGSDTKIQVEEAPGDNSPMKASVINATLGFRKDSLREVLEMIVGEINSA
jgi:hypothetical protein